MSGSKTLENNRIVIKPQIVDFHIHSAASTKTRDKGKTKLEACGKEKIPELVSHLVSEDNQVTMCAITDHDYFDYEMYTALKAHEGNGSLKCVLPGVEFTVDYYEDDCFPASSQEKSPKPTTIHIVAIFDDKKDPEALRHLNKHIVDEAEKPKYDSDNAFSSDEFTKILRAIGLNVILIGHEKSAGGGQENDISSLLPEQADEVILTEFVDAIELKNRHKELNIKKLISFYTKDNVPFILGSDCHDCDVYPFVEERPTNERNKIAFSSIKCLPSFKGLVMAITDHSRIKVGQHSFFSAASSTQSVLDLTVDGEGVSIPLSPGINALIGDNSIGKSLILHKATSYRNTNDKLIRDGYEAYCGRENFNIKTRIPDANILQFDNQEKVRKTLEKLHAGELGADLFEDYFEHRIDIDASKQGVKLLFETCCNALESKLLYNDYLDSLALCTLEIRNIKQSTSPSVISRMTRKDIRSLDALFSDVQQEIANLRQLEERHSSVFTNMNQESNQLFNDAVAMLEEFLKHLTKMRDEYAFENMKKDALKSAAKHEQDELRKRKTDEQNQADAYAEELRHVSEMIAEAFQRKEQVFDSPLELKTAYPSLAPTSMGNFIFVSERNPKKLDKSFLRHRLEDVFNKGNVPQIIQGFEGSTELRTAEVAAAVSRDKPAPEKCMDIIFQKLCAAIDESISERLKITNKQIGIDSEPSPGLYAQLYFDLISESDDLGIYIIDQPEDQISQTAIRENVLDAFKRMSERRQIILVTHNPQFVVNLDVDNVIALSRNETEKILVQYGALEYEDDDYAMLDVVAETVEGGADVVKKRLKRYSS